MRALVLLCLALAACSDATGQPGSGSAARGGGVGSGLPFAWPPKVGEPYPAIELVDQTGAPTRLDAFKGRIVLVELTAMTCAGCIAFVGGHEHGAFAGHGPQADLKSIHEYAKTYGKVSLDDPRVVYVQLLLYGLDLKAPSADDAKRWAAHFKRDRTKDQIVLAADARFIGPASHAMIPGFHLIDADGVLKGDSSGHAPTENLYTDLLPRMGTLVAKIKR